ncbi:MAG: class I SAM-dependent methyltransferase [Candidatus Pacebacteria bacterium]|mgnify:CR=1 FL=1|jgi:2-polyprenyl-3-methyl-5-hydroxy-6-metoxy-1,4-benzoquinol methylase|nr:class I SAM-dependent methyltransferase [Candidatus Paceibacterota bacterium]MBT6756068.1 class I SAM-dependent methyltransferase [Candidatus Paceibacterota bacterium]
MNTGLTSKSFWLKYWQTKDLVIPIKKNYPFSDLFQKYCSPRQLKTFLEIGGFPGYFAIYLKKHLGYEVSLLDYVVQRKTIHKLLKKNGLKKKDLIVHEKDFFNFSTKKKYDVVFSSGFIEHFENYDEIIKKHWQLTNKGGVMLIILPNLLGLNGHFQLMFDPDNLNIHNLSSMNIKSLKKIIKNLNPSKFEVRYYGGLSIWLENLNQKSLFQKLLVYGVYAIGKIFKLFRINSKFTSPFIYLVAHKK